MKLRRLPDLSSKPWKDFFEKLSTAKPSEVFDFNALDVHLDRGMRQD